MRKVTKRAVDAFFAGRPFTSGNTTVVVENGTAADNVSVTMLLHGNMIAKRLGNELYITDAGWQTNTTKERLNGLPGVSIHQKNWTWYLNGEKWDGRLTKVVKPTHTS